MTLCSGLWLTFKGCWNAILNDNYHDAFLFCFFSHSWHTRWWVGPSMSSNGIWMRNKSTYGGNGNVQRFRKCGSSGATDGPSMVPVPLASVEPSVTARTHVSLSQRPKQTDVLPWFFFLFFWSIESSEFDTLISSNYANHMPLILLINSEERLDMVSKSGLGRATHTEQILPGECS